LTGWRAARLLVICHADHTERGQDRRMTIKAVPDDR